MFAISETLKYNICLNSMEYKSYFKSWFQNWHTIFECICIRLRWCHTWSKSGDNLIILVVRSGLPSQDGTLHG